MAWERFAEPDWSPDESDRPYRLAEREYRAAIRMQIYDRECQEAAALNTLLAHHRLKDPDNPQTLADRINVAARRESRAPMALPPLDPAFVRARVAQVKAEALIDAKAAFDAPIRTPLSALELAFLREDASYETERWDIERQASLARETIAQAVAAARQIAREQGTIAALDDFAHEAARCEIEKAAALSALQDRYRQRHAEVVERRGYRVEDAPQLSPEEIAFARDMGFVD